MLRFAVLRRGDSIAVSQSVRVNSRNGTAKAGVDFECLDRVLSFPVGCRQCDLDLQIFKDDNLWFDQRFAIELSLPSSVDREIDAENGCAEIGYPGLMVVEILDVCLLSDKDLQNPFPFPRN